MKPKLKRMLELDELKAIFDQAAGLTLDGLEELTAGKDRKKTIRVLETVLTICEAGSAKAKAFEADGKALAKAS